MKISGLHVENVGALTSFDARFEKPIVLVGGLNAVGKTTLLDCIRMALTGEIDRVQFKKDYDQILSSGTHAGYATALIGDSNTAYRMDLPKGAAVVMGDDVSIPYLLDMKRFSSADANTKRVLLSTITNTAPTADLLSQKMLERECNADFVKRIETLLVSGIDAALKHAKNMATEAKGAWRSVTGETYGGSKAETWRMSSPKIVVSIVSDEKKARELVAELDQQLATNQQQMVLLGAAISEAIAHNHKIDVYSKKGSKEAIIRLNKKLDADGAEYNRILELVENSKGTPLTCPCCNEPVVLRDGQLVTVKDFVPMPAEKLQTYEQSLRMLLNAINNDKRDIAEALTAQTMLEELGGVKDIELIKSNEQAIKQRIQAIKSERDAAKNKADQLKADMQHLAESTQKTKQAAGYHQEVVEWSKIAEALSPSGIPSEMLGEALDEINLRLTQSSEDSTWQLVKIDADMAITYGGRAFGLLSESEQWRVNAMITEAISFISQNKFFALDRMDVLDPASRGNCLAWLETLADNNEIDTAFVAATLKQKPSDSDVMQVAWLNHQPQLSIQAAA